MWAARESESERFWYQDEGKKKGVWGGGGGGGGGGLRVGVHDNARATGIHACMHSCMHATTMPWIRMNVYRRSVVTFPG